MDEDNNNNNDNNNAEAEDTSNNEAREDGTSSGGGGGAENVEQQQAQSEREQVLEQYRAKIREHREVEARLKRMREDVKGLQGRYQKTEDDLSALQSVGQIIGDVLKRLDAERFIVKASSGPRYVVGCRTRLNHDNLKPGTRVALDMTTLTIMRILPREVDPTVFHMQAGEEDGGVSFADIGGLNEQIRELREVIELPLTNPELFIRVGIKVRVSCLLCVVRSFRIFDLVLRLATFFCLTKTSHSMFALAFHHTITGPQGSFAVWYVSNLVTS